MIKATEAANVLRAMIGGKLNTRRVFPDPWLEGPCHSIVSADAQVVFWGRVSMFRLTFFIDGTQFDDLDYLDSIEEINGTNEDAIISTTTFEDWVAELGPNGRGCNNPIDLLTREERLALEAILQRAFTS